MKTTKFELFRRFLLLTLLMTFPGLSLAADVCESLSPEMEMACLQIYLQDLGLEAEGYEINNSISGTWYNPERDGEGFMIDVANHGEIVISFYTYDNQGNQLWLIGDGDVDSSIAVIDFYITDGGLYGSAFDESLVDRVAWGSGTFTFLECAKGIAEIVPNADFSNDFENLTTHITRLTVPMNCTPKD